MLVVVNQPHTDGFRIEGNIPSDLLKIVRRNYGKENVSCYNDGEETVDPFEMDWFKEIEAEKTPGGNLRFYRKLNKLTQAQLAEKLGTSMQAISQMENDKRPISGKTAKQLAKILGTNVSRFLF